MGTRGLNGFVVKGKHYGQYNQFDTYPAGLGTSMVALARKITKNEGWNKFKRNAKVMQDIGAETTDQVLIERYGKFTDLEVSDRKPTDTYCLFRHLQGISFLEEVYKGTIEHYRDDMKFAKDSLFCEYGYFFNLDTGNIEFYKGYQHGPQKGNIFGTKPNKDGDYPIKLVGQFPLNHIPRNWQKIFGEDE